MTTVTIEAKGEKAKHSLWLTNKNLCKLRATGVKRSSVLLKEQNSKEKRILRKNRET